MFQTKLKQLAPINATTIIGAGTTIKGNVESEGDLRIDGKVIGDVIGKGKVLIGPDGEILGNLNGQNADVLGKVKGNITITDLLQLKGKATIEGDIFADKMQMEATCVFNGTCHMGASIVNLHQELPQLKATS